MTRTDASPAATSGDDLRAAASERPDGLALHCDDGRWTWRELDAAADAVADRCLADAVPAGSVGVIREPPSSASIAALFGLWRAGLVAAPLHERLAPAEFDRALRLVRPALQLTRSAERFEAGDGPVRPASHPVRPPRRFEAGGGSARPALRFVRQAVGSVPAGHLRDVDVLLLTSGSSGGSKAVGLARSAFAASAVASAQRLSLTSRDRWGLCLSLGHVGGLALVLRAVALRCALRCWRRFDAEAVARAALAGEVTHLSLVPAMLGRVLDRLDGDAPPPALRCVLVGGAALSPKLLERAVAAGLPVAPTWGMTETASQVATAPPDLARRTPGTVGPPLQGLETKVCANTADGRRDKRSLDAEPGGTGVLAVRGPTLASVLIPQPGGEPEPLPVDAQGWFRTPDVGRLDADGHVWVEGRADDVIVTGGVNVAPSEVERVVEGMTGVSEAVVFGVPDEEWGQRVAAVVEADGAAVGPADVYRHCRARLSRAQCPSRIEVVDSLPRTPTGKADRAAAASRNQPAPSLAWEARPGS